MLLNLNKETVIGMNRGGCEGLIIRGCGGDLNEWIDGIHEMLADEGILLNGTKFQLVVAFQDGELTCLAFVFTYEVEQNMDMGKLAMWRLKTREMLGGVWMSDYADQNEEVAC